MSEWPRKTLGDICREGGGFIRTGPFGSQLHRSDYTDDPNGIPVVMPKDMARGRIDGSSVARIDESTAAGLKQHLLAANDVVLSRRGDVGRTAWVFESDLPAFCGTGSIRVHPGKSETVRSEYLRFFFHTKLASDYLEGHAVGATMPNLNAGIVERLPVPVPPLPIQDSLIAVLEAFDELIENNRRRVDLLAEMTRAIHREWFVMFRFPGHENVSLVDSARGPIPKGWRVTAISEVASIDKGLSYKGAFLTGTGVPMANLKCIAPGGGFRHRGTKPYSGPFKPKHSVSPGDLVMANTDLTQAGAVIGSPALIPRRGFEEGGILSHHLFVVRPVEPELISFLYGEFAGPQFRAYARGVASGTTVLGFRPADLLAYTFVMPPEAVVAEYAEMADNWRQLAGDIEDSTNYLSMIRDMLLPKLVTGQIDLSMLDLNALVEGAVA